jgi:predicted AAA+ superfamily ATPase
MVYKRHIMTEIDGFIDSQEAIVITGMRRTGKTTILKYYHDNIGSENKIYLDLENITNRRYLEDENYEKIRKTFEFLGIDFTKRAFVFIDEIQFAKNIPSIVKYFIDHYNTKFFLTGSASFYLKNLFTESLAGRKILFELFPLVFSEFLIFKNIKLNVPKDANDITKGIFDTVESLYEEYLLYGGLPGVVLKTNIREKKKSIEDVFNSYFQLEVIQLGDFRKNEVIRDLILLLMECVGSKIDIQRFARDLGVSRPTIYEYLAFLEGTYFIALIKPVSKGRSVEIRKTPKIYICDTGLLNHFTKLGNGSIFENSVFQNLRTKGVVNYYQKKSGVEIDFVLNRDTAYEVKITAKQSDIRKLKNLATELGLNEYKIISKNFSSIENQIMYGFML